MVIITDESCLGYSLAGHPERPQRIATTVELLKKPTTLPLTWLTPQKKLTEEILLRAHSPKMLARLDLPENFDADTPYFENISALAKNSVNAALDALQLAREGKMVFSLMRPPGHHATRENSMGFCYLNNIAVTALEARRTVTQRVAVFDFDVHHGNGTEDILLNQPGLEFFSVHQHPAYPHTGAESRGRNCFNYPVAPAANRTAYRTELARALDDLQNFQPELICVSAGFDAYVRDPLAEGRLLAEDFYWLGQTLRKMNVPFFSLLEGGYSRDLPELILAYLQGVAGK